MSLVSELESQRIWINHWTRAIEGLKAAEEFAKMLPEMTIDQLQYLVNKLQAKNANEMRTYLNFLGTKNCTSIHFPKPFLKDCPDPASDWEAKGTVLTDEEKRSLISDMQNANQGLQMAFESRLAVLEVTYPNPANKGWLINPVYKALFDAMRCIYYNFNL